VIVAVHDQIDALTRDDRQKLALHPRGAAMLSAAVDGMVKDEDLPGCTRRRQGSREPFHLALLLQVIRVEDEDIDGPDTSFVQRLGRSCGSSRNRQKDGVLDAKTLARISGWISGFDIRRPYPGFWRSRRSDRTVDASGDQTVRALLDSTIRRISRRRP